MEETRRGRPKRYAHYEAFYKGLPPVMTKRPQYLNGIGIFPGTRGDTAWIKLRLPKGGRHGEKLIKPGGTVEIKIGSLTSWSWEELETERDRLQKKADKGEALSKSDQPRGVAFTRTMLEVLERQRLRKKPDNNHIFPIPLITLQRAWKQARAISGLDDVTIHDLRRTHSTHSVVAGVDLRTLAGRIGHSDLNMLEKHYAALVGTAQDQAADKFQEVFDSMVPAERKQAQVLEISTGKPT